MVAVNINSSDAYGYGAVDRGSSGIPNNSNTSSSHQHPAQPQTSSTIPQVSHVDLSKAQRPDAEDLSAVSSRPGLRWVLIASACGLAVGAITAWSGGVNGSGEPATSSSTLMMDSRNNGAPSISPLTTGLSPSTSALTFTALNFYHERDGKPGQDYPWLKDVKIIEPHRETTLSVTNPRDGFEYRWEIREGKVGHAGQVHAVSATGTDGIITLKRLEEHVVILEEVNSLGQVTNRLEEEVVVKYVRREIRALTDTEQQELFDAMFQLWFAKVEGGNGKELYGENYADIWAINRLHFKGATGTDVCDHFHDGLGFFVTHTVLTNTFEFSLQLVNPKLTLPYWDYTIESSSEGLLAYDPSKPETRSPLFQSSWFGSADPEDFQVKDGRWAYTEVPSIELNNPDNLRADIYSRMRAPWNMNDKKYMTRGMGKMCQIQTTDTFPWTTCLTDYKAVSTYSDFYSWAWNIAGLPHGTVHIWLGGVIDCDESYAEISALVGADITKELLLLTMYHRKQLFCYGLFRCEGVVSTDMKPKEVLDQGICGCLDYDLTQGDDYLAVLPYLLDVGAIIEGLDEDIQRQVVSFLCSAVTNYGEHSQSSSSLDPTFWPIHPTLERMFDFSVLTGKLTDFEWPDSTVTITNSDGTTTTESISLYADDCLGHRGSDVFPFGMLDNDPTGFEVKTMLLGSPTTGNNLTNREVLRALDPRSNNLPYIYDNFKWPHCEADGIDFDDVWE